MNRYRFILEALVEYEDAIAYYERVHPGLGDTLVRDVDRVIATILEFPEIGARVPHTPADLDVRRRIIQRFSIEIDYVIAADEIIIIALFHCKRRPGYWRDRLAAMRRK